MKTNYAELGIGIFIGFCTGLLFCLFLESVSYKQH